MAYDILGTFNKSQFNRFATFARAQLQDIGYRINHLTHEMMRIGSLAVAYDSAGTPTGYKVSSSTTTYIGKLVAAYEVLGGNVIYDLQVRSLSQAVFLKPGTSYQAPQMMSDGSVMGTKGLADAQTARYMQSARGWLYGPLHYRREYIEHKVRRAIDYVDQLKEEMSLLTTVQSDKTTEDSLEWIFGQIGELFTDLDYRAVYDDKGKDPHGKLTYAPYLAYSLTGANPENIPSVPFPTGRDADGARVSGETGELT